MIKLNLLTRSIAVVGALGSVGMFLSASKVIKAMDNPLAAGIALLFAGWIVLPYALLFLATRRLKRHPILDWTLLAVTTCLTIPGITLYYYLFVDHLPDGQSGILLLAIPFIQPAVAGIALIISYLIQRYDNT